MIARNRRSYDLILGSFVAIGLVLLITAIFLIGRERKLFDTTVVIETHFPNVAGLAIGADVMLAGVVVGHVAEIKFPLLKPKVPGLSKDVTVVMEVASSAMKWIREDSLARIDSKGLLGDKIINISIGSPQLPRIPVGGMLKSTAPVDFNKALQQAQEILENVTETVSDAKDIFKGFVAEGGDIALADSTKSLARILKEVEKGKGVIHELIYDEGAGQSTKKSLASLSKTLKQIDEFATKVRQIVTDLKEKDSLVNSLIYDKKGAEVVKNANASIAKLNSILGEIKQGDNVIHDLIYADNEGQFLRTLNKAAKDLELLTSDLKEGKGSLGLLLKDPSLYNELYGLLGNLRRNRLLKAIVRFGISLDDDTKKD